MEKINRPKKTESSSWAVSCHFFFFLFKRKRILLTFKSQPKMCCYKNLVLNIKSKLRKIQAHLVLLAPWPQSPIQMWPGKVCQGALLRRSLGQWEGAGPRSWPQRPRPRPGSPAAGGSPSGSSPRRGFGLFASLYWPVTGWHCN